MAEYKRNIAFELIDKSRKWNAQGCHCWSLENAGNVNVTINKILILLPGERFEGPPENPQVIDYSDIDIEFDAKNEPTMFAPVGGTNPNLLEYVPGDPPPPRDCRLNIYKTFLERI